MTLPNDIDTGVATNPTARPSTFTPANLASGGMLLRPTTSTDTGVGTSPAALTNTFDDTSIWITVVPSPGY